MLNKHEIIQFSNNSNTSVEKYQSYIFNPKTQNSYGLIDALIILDKIGLTENLIAMRKNYNFFVVLASEEPMSVEVQKNSDTLYIYNDKEKNHLSLAVFTQQNCITRVALDGCCPHIMPMIGNALADERTLTFEEILIIQKQLPAHLLPQNLDGIALLCQVNNPELYAEDIAHLKRHKCFTAINVERLFVALSRQRLSINNARYVEFLVSLSDLQAANLPALSILQKENIREHESNFILLIKEYHLLYKSRLLTTDTSCYYEKIFQEFAKLYNEDAPYRFVNFIRRLKSYEQLNENVFSYILLRIDCLQEIVSICDIESVINPNIIALLNNKSLHLKDELNVLAVALHDIAKNNSAFSISTEFLHNIRNDISTGKLTLENKEQYLKIAKTMAADLDVCQTLLELKDNKQFFKKRKYNETMQKNLKLAIDKFSSFIQYALRYEWSDNNHRSSLLTTGFFPPCSQAPLWQIPVLQQHLQLYQLKHIRTWLNHNQTLLTSGPLGDILRTVVKDECYMTIEDYLDFLRAQLNFYIQEQTISSSENGSYRF